MAVLSPSWDQKPSGSFGTFQFLQLPDTRLWKLVAKFWDFASKAFGLTQHVWEAKTLPYITLKNTGGPGFEAIERFTLGCSTPIHPSLWRPLVCVFWSWPLWDVTILMRLWSAWRAMCGRGHPGEGKKENNGSMGLISCGGGKSPTKKIEVLLRNLRGPAVFKTRISILLYRWSRWCGCRINYLQRRVRPQGRWTYC